MAFNTIRTIFNIGLETSKMLGVPYTPLTSSTLNELYNLNTPGSSEPPTLNYFAIGLRYDDLFVDNGLAFSDISRDPDDIFLQRPIPFLAVKKSIGLTEQERNTYRLFVERMVNGEVYILAFIKTLSKDTRGNGFYNVTFEDNTYTAVKIDMLDKEALNNTPNPKVTLYKDKYNYIGYRHTVDLYLTDIEIENIKSACDLLYPDVDGSVQYKIGEIALISGSDVSINNNVEISNAQCGWYSNTFILLNKLTTANGKVKVESIDIGGLSMKFKEMDDND